MKVLTVWQPHASLIALGIKPIETRGWATKYRGPLAIHAAARKPDIGSIGDFGIVGAHSVARDLHPGIEYCVWAKEGWAPAPLGAIVATCTLVDVVPIIAQGSDPHRDAGFVSYVLALNDRSLRLCDWANTGWGDGVESFGARHVDIEDQLPYGDFSTPGRCAWLLADIVPVDPPVPFKGAQGLTKTWEPAA